MGWGEEPHDTYHHDAPRPHPLMSPWAEVDRLKAEIERYRTEQAALNEALEDRVIQCDEFRRQRDRSQGAYERERDARQGTQAELDLKREYIAVLLTEIEELRGRMI